MKTEQIHIRVTPEEKRELLLLSGKTPLSEYILSRVIQAMPVPLPPGKVEFVPEQIPQKKIVEIPVEKPVLAKKEDYSGESFKVYHKPNCKCGVCK